jgi:hypothetical protein
MLYQHQNIRSRLELGGTKDNSEGAVLEAPRLQAMDLRGGSVIEKMIREAYRITLDDIAVEKEGNTGPSERLVKEEKSLRAMIMGQGNNKASITINTRNLPSAGMDWILEVETFFNRSPLARNVLKVLILHQVKQATTTSNMTTINDFPESKHLTELYYLGTVGFVRGKMPEEVWIGDRSDTREQSCLLGFTAPNEEGDVEFSDLSRQKGDEDSGGESEAEVSDFDPENTMMITVGASQKKAPGVKAFLARFSRKWTGDRCKGFVTYLVKFRDQQRLDSALEAARLHVFSSSQEGVEEVQSFSAVLACRASDPYKANPRGVII